jgi:hypothetical protein
MSAPMLICDCCGNWLKDTPEENAWNGLSSHPTGDLNSGMCRSCEEWASETFFGVRRKLVAEALNPENRAKFMAMPKEKQNTVVAKLIERGCMI